MATGLLQKFVANTRGNFAVMFGILSAPLLLATGVAIDYANIINLRNKAMQIADAALMAAAANVRDSGQLDNLDPVAAQAQIESMLIASFKTYYDSNLTGQAADYLKDYEINYDRATGNFSVNVDIQYDPLFAALFSTSMVNFDVKSMVHVRTRASALSMELVLDKSGSMGDEGRIEGLKAAVAAMMTDFAKTDPDNKYVRVGATAYDLTLFGSSDIAWDRSQAAGFVQSLVANGGTASTKAFELAWQELRHLREQQAHDIRNGITAKKAMVFLTDGDNNNMIDDTQTRALCDKAKDDGIVVYTVALQAPARGQALLQYCATSAETYYDADNADALVAAFRAIGKSAAGDLVFTQ